MKKISVLTSVVTILIVGQPLFSQTNPLLVADLTEGVDDSYPNTMAVMEHNKLLFFNISGLNSDSYFNLLDGTSNTVTALKTFSGGFSTPAIEVVAEERAVFTGFDPAIGHELWTTDGTVSGTFLLKDLNESGTHSSYLKFGAVLDGKVFFIAKEDGNGNTAKPFNLWVTDGTEAGTVRLADSVNYGTTGPVQKSIFTIFKNLFYFYAYNPATQLTELWMSNGTEAGTQKLLVFNTFDPQEEYFAVLDDALYFHGYDAAHGEELWRSKGTFTSTKMVKDINPGTAGSSPKNFTVFKDKIFFIANNGAAYNIWYSNGTLAGTQPLSVELESYNYIAGATSSTLYFERDYSAWLTDGSDGGTAQLAYGNEEVNDPREFFEFNGEGYFIASGDYGIECLYKNDGTPEGTTIVPSHCSLGGNDVQHVEFGGKLFYVEGDEPDRIFITDGINTEEHEFEYPYFLAQDSQFLYMSFFTDSIGTELWKLDMSMPVSTDEECNGIDDNGNGVVDDIAYITDPVGSVLNECKNEDETLFAHRPENATYQWMKAGVPIPGATSFKLTTTEQGKFSVIVHSGTCTDTSAALKINRLKLPPATVTPLGDLDICQTGSVVLEANSSPGYTYLWRKGSSYIGAATAQTYTATVPAKYSVRVIDTNGCEKISKKVEVTSSCKGFVSVEYNQNDLVVYPNPSSGAITLKWDLDIGEEANIIQFADIFGRMVWETSNPYQGSSISLQLDTSLPDGFYIIRIISGDKILQKQFELIR